MTRYAVDFQEVCWQRAYVEADTPEEAMRLVTQNGVSDGEILSIETQYSEMRLNMPIEVYLLDNNDENETLIATF